MLKGCLFVQVTQWPNPSQLNSICVSFMIESNPLQPKLMHSYKGWMMDLIWVFQNPNQDSLLYLPQSLVAGMILGKPKIFAMVVCLTLFCLIICFCCSPPFHLNLDMIQTNLNNLVTVVFFFVSTITLSSPSFVFIVRPTIS